MSMDLPPGYRFSPTNYEIVTEFLLGKIRGEIVELDEIKQESVYAVNPKDLNWNRVAGLNDYERYYFVKRTSLALDHNQAKKKNANRVLKFGQGFWKKSYTRPILNHQNQVVGEMSHLNFILYRDPHLGSTRDNRLATPFLMHEFSLCGDNNFQEWVICRVKDTHKENNKSECEMNYYVAQPQPQQLISHEEGQQLIQNHHHEAPLMAAPDQPELGAVDEYQVEDLLNDDDVLVKTTEQCDNQATIMSDTEMDTTMTWFLANCSALDDLPSTNVDPTSSCFRIPHSAVYEQSHTSLHGAWLDNNKFSV